MTLGTPIPADTILAAAGVAGGLAVIAYILKMRRRRFEVPFSTLWQRVLKEKETTSLWRHLRRLLSLLLMLLMLGLLLFAALDPHLGQADPDARSVVVIIDTSASMKTVDEGEDGDRPRIEIAKQKARELLDALGGGDEAMLVRMDGQTTPLSRFESDVPRLRRIVDELAASDTPADLASALAAASDALRWRRSPMIVIIGDGAYPEDVLARVSWDAASTPAPEPAEAAGRRFQAEHLDEISLSGIDVRYVPVGKQSSNVGIVAFNVRRYVANKLSYEVFIEVQNFGEEATSRRLVLYNGQLAVDVRTLHLQAGQTLRQIYPNLGGGQDHRLRAKLEPATDKRGVVTSQRDVFPLDDEAFALLPTRKRQEVLLVTADNLYLEGAMLVYDNIQVDKLTPEEFDSAVAGSTLPAYDAVVLDGHTPARLPDESTHLVYFAPEGEHSPFEATRTLSNPRVTEVNDSHPVMRWIVLDDVNFDETSVFRVDRDQGEVVLARSVRAPIIAAKKDGMRKIVAFGFNLAGTDLVMRVAFPLLFVNILDWFAGDDSDLITTYATGRRLRVPMDGTYGISEVSVRNPDRRVVRAPLVDGQATFYGNSIGIHQLTAKDGGQTVARIELAANLANPSESNITPAAELIMGDKALRAPKGFSVSHRTALWHYLVLLVVLLLCVEWVTYNRRVTV